jgi:hypothetical protein
LKVPTEISSALIRALRLPLSGRRFSSPATTAWLAERRYHALSFEGTNRDLIGIDPRAPVPAFRPPVFFPVAIYFSSTLDAS